MPIIKCKTQLPTHIYTQTPSPPFFFRALSLIQTEDSTRRGQTKEGLEWRGMRRRRRCMGLGRMPVMPCLEASTKVLKILILRTYHPPKLIMLLLDKSQRAAYSKVTYTQRKACFS